MTNPIRMILATAALLAFAAIMATLFPAHGQSRIYDERGIYRGRIEPSPYSGRCCAVYDQRGQYRGRVEQPRPRATQPRDDRRQR